MKYARLLPPLASLLLTGSALAAPAASTSDDLARAVSGPGTYAFLAAGVGLPLLRDGDRGRERAWRGLDAVGVTFLLTEGLKRAVRERRPDGSGDDSFPSAHTSTAFAVATMEASFHPREAPYWYLGASLIGASRLQLDKHYLQDVLAGAAFGYGVARLELGLPRGIVLRPLIGTSGGGGLALAMRF